MSSASADLETWLVHHTTVRKETLFTDGRTVGDWRLLGLLGRGGSGEVWRARQVSTGRTAAVKFLHRTTDQARERFRRESDLLQTLSLPGVSRFVAAGEADGIPFLATEELEELPFPDEDDAVARLVLDLVPTLAVLHRIGIIHRDVKPSNILGRRDAAGRLRPVLIDLGLLKHLTPAGLPVTDTLSVVEGRSVGVGTPGYAAPEQLTGGELSPATDVHALGMLANHCFHGNPPPVWRPIIRRATSSIPMQRYETVQDLGRAVSRRHRARNAVRATGLGILLLAAGAASFAALRALALHDVHRRDDVFVLASAPANGDGTEERPFNTITAGIDAVNPRGTVHIGAGEYDESLVVSRKPVTLDAPERADRTVVRGHWGAPVITICDLGSNTIVRGLTFTGGSGYANSEYYRTDHRWSRRFYGGGAFCSSPAHFSMCRFVGNGHADAANTTNRTTHGGGVFVWGVPVTFSNCVVSNNYARDAGGGIAVSDFSGFVNFGGGEIVANHTDERPGVRRIGGLAILPMASARSEAAVFADNDGAPFGSTSLAPMSETSLTLRECRVAGGACANGIQTFDADAKSLFDDRQRPADAAGM